jgi:Spy/CpxP family protein refolding chaperone
MSASHSISITSASTYASVGTQSGQSLQPFANLDLTEAQRTSLRAILANAKKTGESKADVTKQIDALLTPAQQQTLASDLKAGPASGSGSGGPQQQSFANLDLTATQSTALSSILANAKSTGESQADVQKQIDAVLTTAQQQTLASDIKAGPPSSTSAASDASTANSSASDSSSTSDTSTDQATLAAVTNIQNQAAAAQSARINALLSQVLSTNTPSLQ